MTRVERRQGNAIAVDLRADGNEGLLLTIIGRVLQEKRLAAAASALLCVLVAASTASAASFTVLISAARVSFPVRELAQGRLNARVLALRGLQGFGAGLNFSTACVERASASSRSSQQRVSRASL